jgi:signal recognition particle GTPase
MVLTELGSKIAGALHRMTESTVIDEEVVDQMVKEIGKALIESDVNVRLVFEIQKKIKKGIDFEVLPPGVNKRKLVQNVRLFYSTHPMAHFAHLPTHTGSIMETIRNLTHAHVTPSCTGCV